MAAKRKPAQGRKSRSKKGTARKPRATPGEWQDRFLEAYRQSGIIGEAAKEAGVAPDVPRHHRRNHPEFAAAMRACRVDAADALEGIARQRAEAGSDTLMIFLLKALRPRKYRERFDHRHSGRVALTVQELSDAELSAIAAGGASADQPG